jgi:hypothetical protein
MWRTPAGPPIRERGSSMPLEEGLILAGTERQPLFPQAVLLYRRDTGLVHFYPQHRVELIQYLDEKQDKPSSKQSAGWDLVSCCATSSRRQKIDRPRESGLYLRDKSDERFERNLPTDDPSEL